MTKIAAGFAAALIGLLLGGSLLYVFYLRSSDEYADCRGATVGGGAIGGPFTLTDQDGKTVTDKDVISKPTLVYFGYTFCPDVCPLDNARNAEAVDILEEKGFDVTPVFISIDPARDTPAVMKDYVQNVHPKMIGLTGTEEQVKSAAKAYKAFYQKQADGGEFYLMDHSTFTYLMDPKKGFIDFFNRDDTANQVADRAACFLGKG